MAQADFKLETVLLLSRLCSGIAVPGLNGLPLL